MQRVTFSQADGKINVRWQESDNLNLRVGTEYAAGTTLSAVASSIQQTSDGGTTATFTGTCPTSTNGTALAAVLTGSNVKYTYPSTVNGSTQYVVGVGLSSQAGTLDDAGKYDVIMGTGTYQNKTATMNFDHKMAILKVTLALPSGATSLSNIALGAKSGLYSSFYMSPDGTTLTDITTNGGIHITKTLSGTDLTFYAAVYPTSITDLYVYAEGSDGTPYVTRIGTKTLTAGKVQAISKSDLTAPFSGQGTTASPYLMTSESNLQMLALLTTKLGAITNKQYKQTADITLSATNEWLPITLSGGTYDGNSKAINGTLKISATDSENPYSGIFGSALTNSVIKNLTSSVTVSLPTTDSGNNLAFGLVGRLQGGTIQDCTNNSAITGNYHYMGGIVGYATSSAKIFHCTNAGAVTNSSTYSAVTTAETVATSYSSDGAFYKAAATGGLVGAGNNYYVIASMNTGAVTSTNANSSAFICTGGLVGYIYTATKANFIRGCRSTSSVTTGGTKGAAGGLIGITYCNVTTAAVGTAINSVMTSSWTSVATTALTGATKAKLAGRAYNSNIWFCGMFKSADNDVVGGGNGTVGANGNINPIRYTSISGTTTTSEITDLSYWCTRSGTTLDMNSEWSKAASGNTTISRTPADGYHFDANGNITANT